MDNDKQIKEIRPEIKLFLRDELLPEMPDMFDGYNFEREFSRTKKTKRHFVPFLMIAAVIVSAGITAGVSAYQLKQNKKITVAINSFQDLNLKKLLASFQKIQNELDSAITEKNQLKKNFQTAMENAGFTKNTALLVIDSMLLNQNEKTARSKAIEEDYTKTTRQLEFEYNNKLGEIDQKIASLQTQVNSLKTPELEKARTEQGVSDSREQVFTLQKQKLVQSYEQQLEEQRKKLAEMQKQGFENQKNAIEAVSKQFQQQINSLDPVITDKKANTLAAEAAAKPVELTALPAASNQLLLPAESENLKKIQENVETVSYLSGFLLDTPQKNSIPQYVLAIKNSTVMVVNTVTELIQTSMSDRENSRKEIKQLQTEQDKIMGGLKKEVADKQIQLDTAAKNLTDITARYADLNTKNAELTKNFTAANNSASTLTRQNATLTNQLQTADVKIAELTTRLTTTSSQVNEIQKTLNEATVKLRSAEAEASVKFQMENYLTELVKKTNDAAFIVDIGDRKSFLIQVHPDQTTRIENRTVYVFSRETSKLLGTAIIRKKGANFYAYPENSALGQVVSLNDRISLTSTLQPSAN